MDMMVIAALVFGVIFGLAFGIMRGKQQLAGAVARSEYEREVAEKTTLLADVKNMQGRVSELNLALEGSNRELLEARERIHSVKAAKESLEKELASKEKDWKENQELLKLQFKDMSAVMLEEMGAKFTVQSEKKLGELLLPMKDKLVGFEKLVVDNFTQEGKERHSLKDVIEKIVMQTDSLSKALRGDVKAQGNWGEIMLERILEASGLEKGVGYVTQGSEMGLMDGEGNRQRPDVIVNLPDNKHIIVDSKVSLVAYERYCAEGDEVVRAAHLKDFLRSVNAHVAGLSGKNYPDIKGLETPEIVLLFMPIEGAFSLAVQQDLNLHSAAWNKRVAIVSPSTLFISLQTVASLWKIEKQNKYAEEIAKRGASLYDKFVGFVETMMGIDRQLKAAQGSYDKAMGQLSQGTGNLVRQAEMMKDLGLKASKSLPKEMLGDYEGEVPQLVAAEG